MVCYVLQIGPSPGHHSGHFGAVYVVNMSICLSGMSIGREFFFRKKECRWTYYIGSLVFGLWRVCFPPCLVRPGRRLPVQGLIEGSLGFRDRLPA